MKFKKKKWKSNPHFLNARKYLIKLQNQEERDLLIINQRGRMIITVQIGLTFKIFPKTFTLSLKLQLMNLILLRIQIRFSSLDPVSTLIKS